MSSVGVHAHCMRVQDCNAGPRQHELCIGMHSLLAVEHQNEAVFDQNMGAFPSACTAHVYEQDSRGLASQKGTQTTYAAV